MARKVLMKEVSQVPKLLPGWMDECAHRRRKGRKGRGRGEDAILKIQPSALA